MGPNGIPKGTEIMQDNEPKKEGLEEENGGGGCALYMRLLSTLHFKTL